MIINWPPPYSIKRSSRARRVNLKISIRNGLELTVPLRYKIEKIPQILAEKRRWIEKHLLNIQQYHYQSSLELPTQIYLQSCSELWKINYVSSGNKAIQIIIRPNYELIIYGQLDDPVACQQALRHWLQQKAQQILLPWLYQLSAELKLPFKRLTIRNQKTRWGSCSAEKSISLNYRLIFLAPELVRHIMIHELCHTVHFSHSQKFWQLVATFDNNWQECRRKTRRSDELAPLWLE